MTVKTRHSTNQLFNWLLAETLDCSEGRKAPGRMHEEKLSLYTGSPSNGKEIKGCTCTWVSQQSKTTSFPPGLQKPMFSMQPQLLS